MSNPNKNVDGKNKNQQSIRMVGIKKRSNTLRRMKERKEDRKMTLSQTHQLAGASRRCVMVNTFVSL